MKMLNQIKLLLSVCYLSVLALNLVACSSIDGKFEETHEINLAPFSENVTAMASELEFGFEKIRSLYTKWYFDKDSIKLKRLLNLEKLVTNEIHFIVEYSTRIVYLSNSSMPMSKKTSELARYVDQMYSRYSNSKTLTIAPEKRAKLIDTIRKQEKFLPALRTAQPFIDELTRYANRLLDQLKKAEKNLAYYQDDKIETENAHIKSLILSLKKNEKEISKAIVLLNKYEDGNHSAFRKLKKSKVLLEQLLIKTKKSLTDNQIGLLKKHLLNKLTENNNIFLQVEPSYNRYILAQQELIRLVNEHDAELRRTRLIFIAFSSAHRKMASGLVKPAEWFNIKDTPKLLLNFLPI